MLRAAEVYPTAVKKKLPPSWMGRLFLNDTSMGPPFAAPRELQFSDQRLPTNHDSLP